MKAHADFFLEEKGCAHVCIAAQSGDLVLWDSRTIHCGRAAAPKARSNKAAPQLPVDAQHGDPARVVVYTAMQPRFLAMPRTSNASAVP